MNQGRKRERATTRHHNWHLAGAGLIMAFFAAGVLAGLQQPTAPDPSAASAQTAPPATALPGEGRDAGRTVVYRDTWGVPHIYAPSVEAGLYAMGWAQAQDRPTQLLMNLKIALGELSEIAGEQQVSQDLIARLFDHYGMAQRQWPDVPARVRARVDAFADGVNDFYAAHPEDVPAWWGRRDVTPQMVAAFTRMFLYNWSIDEALNDLRRGGIDPGVASPRRASNEWVVGASRSASGHPLLLADPHLSWWGVSRFWQVRVHAGDLQGSGVTLAGNPYIGLGHNGRLAWAMTTGGPDTGDIYALKLNPDNADQYRYDGRWRELRVRDVTLKVKGLGDRQYTLKWSHLGPIVATVGDTAYAARIPYDEHANPVMVWEALNFAQDYRGAVAAGATLAMFPQNLMVADTSGNIYYERTGRVPVRPQGYDFSKPVDGTTSASDWQGLHPAEDLLHVLNPPQGYMQNCNIPPDAMMVGSPFRLDAQPRYLFSSANYGPALSGWINQRGARAIELLGNDDSVTLDEALGYAVDVRPYGIDRWLAALDHSVTADSPTRDAVNELMSWDRRLTRDSRPALKYAYWRLTLADQPESAAIGSAIDDNYAIVLGRDPKPVQLTDDQRHLLAAAFAEGLARMKADLGTTDAPWGRVYRVGRGDASWPVGGGDDHGLTTLRTMGYDKPNERSERWGNRGQTSTQIIELSTPVESWDYLPVGESDRPGSPHYTDQAEKVFSQRHLKPSWWRPEELVGHIESRTVLDSAP